MDSSTLFSVIGIALTILFGIIGIWLVVRKISEVEMIFVRDDMINLYSSVVNKIDGIKITYNNSPINNNMILIRGFIFNTGKRDFTSEMIEDSLKIILPEKGVWHYANILEKSENLHVITKNNINELSFETGLFKTDEYFKFEALAENFTRDNISFKHRISNLKEIKIIDSEQLKGKKRKYILYASFFSLLAFVSIVGYVGYKMLTIENELVLGMDFQASKVTTKSYSIVKDSVSGEFKWKTDSTTKYISHPNDSIARIVYDNYKDTIKNNVGIIDLLFTDKEYRFHDKKLGDFYLVLPDKAKLDIISPAMLLILLLFVIFQTTPYAYRLYKYRKIIKIILASEVLLEAKKKN